MSNPPSQNVDRCVHMQTSSEMPQGRQSRNKIEKCFGFDEACLPHINETGGKKRIVACARREEGRGKGVNSCHVHVMSCMAVVA